MLIFILFCFKNPISYRSLRLIKKIGGQVHTYFLIFLEDDIFPRDKAKYLWIYLSEDMKLTLYNLILPMHL